MLELNDLRGREVLLKPENVLDPCATPAVYGLVVIADDERHAGISGEQPQPGVLNRVGVLELIDEQMAEATPIMCEQLGAVAPQLMRAQQQLREIDKTTALAYFFVGCVKCDELPAIGVSLVVEVLWTQALVLLAIDEILDFARHPTTVIDLEVFQQALDEPQLVVGIDDLKILR